VIVFILFYVFFLSCCSSRDISWNDTDIIEEDDGSCKSYDVPVAEPVKPEMPEIYDILTYSANLSNCRPIPEINGDELVLKAGCYKGCLTVSGNFSVKGAGSAETVIICEDKDAEAVITVEKNSRVNVEKVTLQGLTRGVFAQEKSVVFIRETAISKCTKGGINICGGESDCESELSIEGSVVRNIIPEKGTEISYGVSMGPGKIAIKNSIISGFNSFGLALWGEDILENIVAEIENTVIADVYGGIREYEGHAVYAEGSVKLNITKSEIKNSAASFIYFSASEQGAFLKIKDLTLKNILETGKEQGGIVLEGSATVEMERVSINNSRGNGIFSNGSVITANDITIDSVFSDGYDNNGFGVMLFDGATSNFNRILINNSQIAAVLMDGKTSAEMENFQIFQTRSDPHLFEFGVGVAVQEGSEMIMKNGVIDGNRESGIMAVNGKVELHNVEIKNTFSRECIEKNNCLFASGVPFGHGISLYQESELVIENIYIFNNNNGLNIESSKVTKAGAKPAKFMKNVSAVNAWNISSYKDLEKNLLNSEYCENQSVFTTDVQPVRNGI